MYLRPVERRKRVVRPVARSRASGMRALDVSTSTSVDWLSARESIEPGGRRRSVMRRVNQAGWRDARRPGNVDFYRQQQQQQQ